LQKLFFHNRHDKTSRELLENLPPDVQVIDVYGGDSIPEGYRLSVLPYLVDKELSFITPEQIETGTSTLRWECRDADGNLLTEGDPHFFVTINGETWDDYAVDGVLEVEVDCEEPLILEISVINELDGFAPWFGAVEVVDIDQAEKGI
jgi:hypothetical protein